MNVLVGLGNPGPQYALTRHNIGFIFVDFLAEAFKFPAFKAHGQLFISERSLEGKRFFLCKPTTFMNRSGQGVGPFLNFYKIPLDYVWVIHDDLDLDPFVLKVKRGGGNGGHNGLSDLDRHIGKEYGRVRVGIGRPPLREQVTDYVLGRFSASERGDLERFLGCVAPEIPLLFQKEPSAWLTQVSQVLRHEGFC